jgi:ubiquinol-cytochrome c reductase iron-sulfur subunit
MVRRLEAGRHSKSRDGGTLNGYFECFRGWTPTAMDPFGGVTRRRALYALTTSVVAAGAAAALWPAIDQMNPSASSTPLDVEVDLSFLKPGDGIVTVWRGKPIFIRNRTKDEIEKARAVPLAALPDNDARVMDVQVPLPAIDENRTKPGKENWLVVIGICTRESCILSGQKGGEWRGDYGGWACPCCAAHYDTSGRTRSGIARENLRVPPYRFEGNARLILGYTLAGLVPSLRLARRQIPSR